MIAGTSSASLRCLRLISLDNDTSVNRSVKMSVKIFPFIKAELLLILFGSYAIIKSNRTIRMKMCETWRYRKGSSVLVIPKSPLYHSSYRVWRLGMTRSSETPSDKLTVTFIPLLYQRYFWISRYSRYEFFPQPSGSHLGVGWMASSRFCSRLRERTRRSHFPQHLIWIRGSARWGQAFFDAPWGVVFGWAVGRWSHGEVGSAVFQ